jgi:hypothetical protein
MRPLGAELTSLASDLTAEDAEEVAVGVEQGRVHYCLWRCGGRHVLLAVNASDEATTVTWQPAKLGCTPRPRRVSPRFGQAPVSYRWGRLKTTLAPNEHVVLDLD